MNDHAAVNEYAPYCALILWRHLKGFGFRIPAPSRIPPIDPGRMIGGVRRRDVTYKAWMTRACARFAELHPEMVTCHERTTRRWGTRYDFTASDEQREALEAYVSACRDEQRYAKDHTPRINSPRGESAYFHYNRVRHENRKHPLRECSPSKDLVLPMLTDKMDRKKLESSRRKDDMTSAILKVTNQKASTISAPASDLLSMLREYDCPQETLLACVRLRKTHDVIPVGHIINAARLGWWKRVDVLLDRIERTTRPTIKPQSFPKITRYMYFIASRAILDYLSLPMPGGRIVMKHRTFTGKAVASRTKAEFKLIWQRCGDQRITESMLGEHVVKEFAKSFGFKSVDGRVFYVIDKQFAQLAFHVRQHQHLLTEKPT